MREESARNLRPAERNCFGRALCQGTTSVVPKMPPEDYLGFSPCRISHYPPRTHVETPSTKELS
jgi:hypothetical protein